MVLPVGHGNITRTSTQHACPTLCHPFHRPPLQAICASQLNIMHFLRRIHFVKLLSCGTIFFGNALFIHPFFPCSMRSPFFRVKSELALSTVYCAVIWSLVPGLDGSCYSAICTSSVSHSVISISRCHFLAYRNLHPSSCPCCLSFAVICTPTIPSRPFYRLI